MAENDLTSKEWCDLIFQGRNKEYGAYKMRVDSPKRHSWSLLIIATAVLILVGLLKIIEVTTPKQKEVFAEVANLSQLNEVVVVDMSKVAPKPTNVGEAGRLPLKKGTTPKSIPGVAKESAEVKVATKGNYQETGRVKIVKEMTEEQETGGHNVSVTATNKLVADAFGKSKTLGNRGTSTGGTGVEGSPQGDSNTGTSTGIPGGHGTFDLNGRSLGNGGLPKPVYNVKEEGKVVVTIVVNPSGIVISTSINKRTNTVNSALRKAAEDAAKKARFNSVSGVNNQTGTITYYFNFK
jgi:TonB family C-terminal domain